MTRKYQSLFDHVTLPNGTQLANRFVLSPMITNSSTREGYVTDEDIKYSERRAYAAPLQITGAAYIDKFGQLFEFGYSIDDDRSIEGLRKLAKAMKRDGAKAIIQLTHAGRFSKITLKDFGIVYGPSHMELNTPINHTVLPMSKRHINHVIEAYADATRRAIAAGFDGIEISSAQRLLIQSFLSTFSNKRNDEYGGSPLENRMRFGLEVIQAVQKIIDEEAPKDFIFGYRGTPEETRGDDIGYSVDDFLIFMDHILDIAKIDYLATASWGRSVYLSKIRQGKYKGEYMNKVIFDYFHDRVPIMATGGINSPDKALEALQFSHLVGMSTPFVTEPDFVHKLKDGKENTINLDITLDEVHDLAIPPRAFKDLIELMDIGASLPETTRKELSKLQEES